MLVAKQGLKLQTPEMKLLGSFYLNNLTTVFKMYIIKGVPNVTLKQNIFVFQLKKEEVYIYIGDDVTTVTKVNKLLNF